MRLGYEGGLSRVESPSHKILTKVLELGVCHVQLIDPNPLEKDNDSSLSYAPLSSFSNK